MYEPGWLPYHASQKEAVLMLLQKHPEGVTRSMFISYLYTDKKGHQVGIGWEGRARIADLRKEHHIEHAKRPDGTPAWFYRGPKVADGQLLLPVGA